mmetsp:Transcript_16542/g.18869  ORF Transcript_16542/g.18869 Transcript_16542/m.18869 type:complete len:114 (-) Transcript_16542:15-356(-)
MEKSPESLRKKRIKRQKRQKRQKETNQLQATILICYLILKIIRRNAVPARYSAGRAAARLAVPSVKTAPPYVVNITAAPAAASTIAAAAALTPTKTASVPFRQIINHVIIMLL